MTMNLCQICGNEIVLHKSWRIRDFDIDEEAEKFIQSNLCSGHMDDLFRYFLRHCSGPRRNQWSQLARSTTDVLTIEDVNKYLVSRISILAKHFENNGFVDTCCAMVHSPPVKDKVMHRCHRTAMIEIDGKKMCNWHGTRYKNNLTVFFDENNEIVNSHTKIQQFVETLTGEFK